MKQYKLKHDKRHNMVQRGGNSVETTPTMQFMNEIWPRYCSAEYGNVPPPVIISPKRRIIVMGDIHGDYALMIKYFKLARLIDDNNQWIGGDTYVVQVGDQIDRCRFGMGASCTDPMATINDENSDMKILEFYNEMDKQARVAGGAVISLYGNHEFMNVKGNMTYVSNKGTEGFDKYLDNRESFQGTGADARREAFKPGGKIARMLACTRVPAIIIGPFLFVHAGIVDRLIDQLHINDVDELETIRTAIASWLLGITPESTVRHYIDPTDISMFWTRILGMLDPGLPADHTLCVNNLTKVLKIMKISNMFIGHTPQSFLKNMGINATCGDQIYRVDHGASAAFDTMDPHVANGHRHPARNAQVLEIITDLNTQTSQFNILSDHTTNQPARQQKNATDDMHYAIRQRTQFTIRRK